MDVEKWYFSTEELENTPSRKSGISAEKEIGYRQQSAKLIQDMGQKLIVSQLTINTAIVYMHRFYMYHTFSRFHRYAIAPAALFLAAKVEEQPRKLEHVIKAFYFITHDHHTLDTLSDTYAEKAQELVMNENILLQTLGFDVAIDHPHTYIVKCFHMIRALTNLPQTSYFMATNSLHMTTMCLEYKPAVVACVCIDIVCRWSNYEIQRYTEGKDWFVLVDPTVTAELLERLSAEFIAVLDKFPNRVRKFRSMNSVQHGGAPGLDYRTPRHSNSLTLNARPSSNSLSRTQESISKEAASLKLQQGNSSQAKTVLSHKEYTEKRERERRERERHGSQISSSHPVSSSTQRAHIDQLRMPPPQVVPFGRATTSNNREQYPRKDHFPADKPDRVSDNSDIPKCQDVKNIQNHDRVNENKNICKTIERTKHPPMKLKCEKVEIDSIKQEPNDTAVASSSFENKHLQMKEEKCSTDVELGVKISILPSAATSVIIKTEPSTQNMSQNNNAKSINNNKVLPLYHPRLDGKPKVIREIDSLSQATSLPSAEKCDSKEDVTTITSISKLISQSTTTKAPKVEHDSKPASISSTSHISSKHRSEHSHRHDKDKKKKKSKHKSKEKKEKHKERQRDVKDHKKSKKHKKHKEKERERSNKQAKSIFDDDEDESTLNTPIKVTIIRDKGVYNYAPEGSQITDLPTNSAILNPSPTGLKLTIPKAMLQSDTSRPSPPRGIPPRDSTFMPTVKLKITKDKLKYEKESQKRERSPTENQHSRKHLRTSGGIDLQKVGNSNTHFSQNTNLSTNKQFTAGYSRQPQQQIYREPHPFKINQNYKQYDNNYSVPPPGIIPHARYPFHIPPAEPYIHYSQMGVPVTNQAVPVVNFNIPPPGYPVTGIVPQLPENPPLPSGPPPQAPPPPPE